jgi:hypothetical protein
MTIDVAHVVRDLAIRAPRKTLNGVIRKSVTDCAQNGLTSMYSKSASGLSWRLKELGARFDRSLNSDWRRTNTAERYLWKGLRSLPVVFVDKATEAVAAHDRPSGSSEADGRSAFGNSQVEAPVRSLLVVVLDVGLQY